MAAETAFDYCYGDESGRFSFCRIPRQLVTGDAFKWPPTDARLLYGLLLWRMGLSARPKLGARASLYLPSHDTGEAVAVISPRTSGDGCGDMVDPQMRAFMTEHGKKMLLFPESMAFSGGLPGETLQVKFDDIKCMSLESTRAISPDGFSILRWELSLLLRLKHSLFITVVLNGDCYERVCRFIQRGKVFDSEFLCSVRPCFS